MKGVAPRHAQVSPQGEVMRKLVIAFATLIVGLNSLPADAAKHAPRWRDGVNFQDCVQKRMSQGTTMTSASRWCGKRHPNNK